MSWYLTCILTSGDVALWRDLLGRARGNHNQAAEWMAQIGANVPLAAKAARDVPGTNNAPSPPASTCSSANSHMQGYDQKVLTAMIWMCVPLKLELLPHSSVLSLSNASETQCCFPQAKRMSLHAPHAILKAVVWQAMPYAQIACASCRCLKCHVVKCKSHVCQQSNIHVSVRDACKGTIS